MISHVPLSKGMSEQSENKAGYTNRLKSRGLGSSGNVEGRGSGECRIHDGISPV